MGGWWEVGKGLGIPPTSAGVDGLPVPAFNLFYLLSIRLCYLFFGFPLFSSSSRFLFVLVLCVLFSSLAGRSPYDDPGYDHGLSLWHTLGLR